MPTTSHAANDIENQSPVNDNDVNDIVEKFYSKHDSPSTFPHAGDKKRFHERTRTIISKALPLADFKASQLRLEIAKALLPIETGSIGSISPDIIEKIAREIKLSTLKEVINRTSKDRLNNHWNELMGRLVCAVIPSAIALGFVVAISYLVYDSNEKDDGLGAYLFDRVVQTLQLTICLLCVCSCVSGRLKPLQHARRRYEQEKSDHEKLIAPAKPGSAVSTVFRQKNGEVKKPGNNHSRRAIM